MIPILLHEHNFFYIGKPSFTSNINLNLEIKYGYIGIFDLGICCSPQIGTR